MNSNPVLLILILAGKDFAISVSQQLGSLECINYPKGIMISSPFQCDRFYICGDGSLSEEATCPPGMLFNPDNQICDFSENVDCRDVPLPPWAQKPTEPAQPHRCPLKDPEYPVFLPVLDSCSSYILCFHGKEILKTCPDGLYWNPEKMDCDDPSNVDCESPGDTFDCPPEGVDFLPHPNDCRRFFYCRDGFVRQQKCFFLKVFDKEQKTCVFRTSC